MARLGWFNNGEPPIVMGGHSFGTFLAYESIREIELNYSAKCHNLISIAGLSREYLMTLPLYKHPFDSTTFEQLSYETVIQMYGELPAFMSESSDSSLQIYMKEGFTLIIIGTIYN